MHNSLWEADISKKELKSIKSDLEKYLKYLHVKCNSCGETYSKSNGPYIQKCGITICSRCNKNETNCSYCFSKKNRKIFESMSNLNKDLNNNFLFLTTAIRDLDTFSTEEIREKGIHNNGIQGVYIFDMILKKYMQILSFISAYGNCIKQILENLKHGCASLIEMCNSLKLLRINLENLKNFQLISKEISEADFKLEMNFFEKLDYTLHNTFTKIMTNEDIQIGLRVADFATKIFTVEQCVPREKNQETLISVAVSNTKGKENYHIIDMFKQHLYVSSCQEKIDWNIKHIFAVDFESLRSSHPLLGFFFFIIHEDKNQYIEVTIDPLAMNSEILKQILLLCTGEEGPCYTGGTVFTCEDYILIKTYKYENNDSVDIISHIPDLGEKFVPTQGMVTVPREYRNGACIRITLKPKENITKEFSIGHADITNFPFFSIQSYEIQCSGLIFDMRN